MGFVKPSKNKIARLKSKPRELKKRGFIEQAHLSACIQFSKDELLNLLNSPKPSDRTLSAKIIAQNKDKTFIDPLITALTTEKKLYSKIAISEALGCLGTLAVKKCIPWLGKIGANQYKTLPEKPFLKNNYPLPRDIISRTICKVGTEAIPVLLENININNIEQLSEGIDAIGYISYYCKSTIAKDYLLKVSAQHTKNDLITWKLIRAFQSFPTEDVINYLSAFLKETKNKPLIWETERSLTQIHKIYV